MSSNNHKLHRARAAKNDEFYTQYTDIKTECDHYRPHFFNKTIYCNCDTADSAFVKYFMALKTAGLVRDVLFSGGLGGDDFRSAESVEKLKAADIVITNPPFSLFREYMDLLFANNKRFLVIGNKNAIAYRNIFERIRNGRMWFGARKWAGGMRFITANGIKAVPAIWYTNLEHEMRPGILPLRCTFSPDCYAQYSNANAINIERTADIPADYAGVMGVPITFFEKYNPKQFEILGLDKDLTTDGKSARLGDKCAYTRVFVRNMHAKDIKTDIAAINI